MTDLRAAPQAWQWWCCASIVLAARFVVADAQLDWDEELYWQVGEVWRQGGIPYADIMDHKPALLYVPQILYSGFTGKIWVLRVTATLVLLGSAAFFARSMWPGRADLTAMLVFLVLLTLSVFGCVGTNSEILYAPYVLLSGGFLLRRAIVPAAVAAAVAANLKYTVGLDIVGLATFVFLAGRLSRKQVCGFLAAFGVASMLLWLGFFVYFRSLGVDLIETTVAANLFHAADDRKPFVQALGTYAVTRFVMVSVALGLAARWSRGAINRGVRDGLLVWAAAALLQATVTGKTFYHYFTPVYLPLCVLVVSRWEHPARAPLRTVGVEIGALLALVLFIDSALGQQEYAQMRDRIAAETCPELAGRSVYVADELLATYRVCQLAPSKYLFPPFIFRSHYVDVSKSLGLDELEPFERVVISVGSRFESRVRKVRQSGVVALPSARE